MNEQAEHYLSTLDRSENTIKTYRHSLDIYFRICGEKLSDEAYEKFLVSIKKHSPSGKRVLCSAVMGLYKFCKAGDLAKRRELNEHYMKKVRRKDINFDRDAIEKIIIHCDGLRKSLIELRDRAFVLNLADSGFRISELCSLMRDDIDWLNRRVSVVGKGDKSALVRLSKRSSQALMDYLQARDDEFGYGGKSEPLFSQHGNVSTLKQMTVDGMRKAIKERMKEVGVRVRIHDFRHYFVTITLLASNNLKIAQELARHESTVTTQRYAHLADHELDKAYDEIFNRKD